MAELSHEGGTPQTELVCIFGRRGTGKSTLGAHLISGWPFNYVWVHDPTEQRLFLPYKKCWRHRPPPSHDCLIFLDEVNRLAPSWGYVEDWVDYTVNVSRNHNVTLVCAAQRPNRVNRDIAANCTRVYLFRLTGASDRKWLLDEWGDDFEELITSTRSLPPYQHITFRP